MFNSSAGGFNDTTQYRTNRVGWIFIHDVPRYTWRLGMAILVLFYAVVAVLSLGMMVMGRWLTVAGVLLFLLDGWAFWEFLEVLKR